MKKNLYLAILDIALFIVMLVSFKDDVSYETNFSFKEEENTQIRMLLNNEIITLDLDEYITGVVAAEMPALFDNEALKAQAIVSRSYALYNKKMNMNNLYDLTGDINNQMYISKEDMLTKWGDKYNIYYSKIKSAVENTKNMVVTYNDDIACTYYFSISNGHTNNVKDVFGKEVDYLTGVNSEFDKNVNRYQVSTEFDYNSFVNALTLSCEPTYIDYINRFENGYIDKISICNEEFTGITFRKLLNLRSSDFDIEFLNNNIRITTRGYGHGVGMSQYGANELAKLGYTYEEIIKYYYKNVEIKEL